MSIQAAPSASGPGDITLQDIMQHMQGMEQRLHNELTTSVEGLRDEVQSMEGRLTKRIDTLEQNVTRQIEGIDERLDEVETRRLPRVERHVGLAA